MTVDIHNRQKISELLGMTEEELNTEAEAFERGNWDRSQYGKPGVGRPSAFGEAMRPVTFKEPLSVIAAIDERAAQMGASRSDYLRDLVAKDLAQA